MINFPYFLIFFFLGQTSIGQNLQLNLKPGETYYYSNKAKGTMEFEMDAEKFSSDMLICGDMSFEVLEVTQEGFKLNTKYLSLFVETNTPEGLLKIDSADEDDYSVFAQVMKQFIGKGFPIKLDRKGFVTEVEMESALNGLLDAVPMVPRFQRVKIIDRLKEYFGQESFKSSIEMFTAIFPNTNVEENDTWTNQIILEGTMGGIVNNTFTLKKYNKRYAWIDVESIVHSNAENTSVLYEDDPFELAIEGTIKSRIKINSKTGWVISSTIEQNLFGNGKVIDAENEDSENTMAMKFINKMVVEGKLNTQ